MKRCLTSLVIKEMQVKTIMRYHPASVRMAIEKIRNSKCWRGLEKRKPLYVVSQNGNWCCHSSWRFLKKLRPNYKSKQQGRPSIAINKHCLPKKPKGYLQQRHLQGHVVYKYLVNFTFLFQVHFHMYIIYYNENNEKTTKMSLYPLSSSLNLFSTKYY